MNSDFSTGNIQKGMDVYDSTGEKIGSVSDVYPGSGSSDFGTGSWDTSNAAPGDVIVEEIDVVAISPDTDTSNVTGTTGNYSGSAGYGTTDTPATGPGTGTAGWGTGPQGNLNPSGAGTATDFGTSTAGTSTMAGTGYFKVGEGGILGIGATDLYIPFSAVASVTDNQINLNCTKDQANQNFQQKPSFLQDTNDETLT